MLGLQEVRLSYNFLIFHHLEAIGGIVYYGAAIVVLRFKIDKAHNISELELHPMGHENFVFGRGALWPLWE